MPVRSDPPPPGRLLRRYHAALQVIAPHWYSGPHKPGYRMPRETLAAYQAVGRFASTWYAPKKGHPHPGKSAQHRLRHFGLSVALPPSMKIVSRHVATTSGRSWSAVHLEHLDPAHHLVRRYRAGLHGPKIAIRGTARGRGSRAANPCDWRPLSKTEAAHLHPAIQAFLLALGSPA